MVRRSTDGGLTWSLPSAMASATGYCGGQCFYDIAIGVTPDNQTIHLGGAAAPSANCGSNVMKRSTNGGTTFVSNNATLHDGHAIAIALLTRKSSTQATTVASGAPPTTAIPGRRSTTSISALRSFKVSPYTR